MKLLIDIPKEIYELIVNDKDKLIGLAGVVQNSIPLEQNCHCGAKMVEPQESEENKC